MKSIYHVKKVLLSAGVFSMLCHASLSHAAVSQQPLVLVESVAPNLIFTLDSSGSMRFGFAPDSMNSARNTKRAKSSTFNPLYYNPEITYLLPVKINSDGSEANSGYSTSFTAAYHNGFKTGNGSVDLSKSYRVSWDWNINTKDPNYGYNNDNNGRTNYTGTGIVYRLAENPSTEFPGKTKQGVPAYYYQYDKKCTNINDESCYSLVNVANSTSQQKQNFAIWYSFYRNRALATLSAANLAFNNLPASIRFTWQDLSTCKTLNSKNCENNYFRSYTDRHKGNFFSWLSDVKFDGGTPLREALARAGEFLTTDSAWAFNPNPMTSNGGNGRTVQTPEYACRPAFHIMMTDGMWNGNNGSPSNSLRSDHGSFQLPGIGSYNSSRRPFGDSNTNTLADLAMHYWATDLNTSLDNEVKPYMPFKGQTENWDPRNNPATWQHMVNYTMGLGLSQSLTLNNLKWEGDTFSGGYHNLLSGSASWPKAEADSSNNVYDLWHAAINSRGEFFSVDRPEDMIQAFNDIINRIAERTATAAAAGAGPSTPDNEPDEPFSFTTVSKVFSPEFNSEDWSGDVKEAVITRDPNGTITRTVGWSAREAIAAQSSRNIFMAGSGASGLQEFSYSNLSGDLKTIFSRNPDSTGNTTDNKGSNRVSYLRGNRDGEGNADTQFRRRSSVLGDIVNSTPAVVGKPQYLPYLADRIEPTGNYLTFQDANAERPTLIYVGANDGMLHALSAEDGSEVFAFIPEVVLKHMPKLTGQSYKGGAHRFFVDGSPLVRDVYINNEWRTVLVGTLRAGGKSLFALDITNPGENGSGVKLLWEVSDETGDYENLGYSFPEPEIVKLHSGEWAILQGNGYESATGAASLFIINIADGSVIKELTVDTGEDAANGLSSVRGADNNSDGIVDYAYAGDLKGNLWRFDLSATSTQDIAGDPFGPTYQSSTNASSYVVSYGGKPLYQATYSNAAQPITAPPSLVRHPTRRGYMVLFGTGKYFETDDAAPDTTKANSIYGIWDRFTRGQRTSGSSISKLTRTDLQQQRVIEESFTSFSSETGSTRFNVRYLTDNAVQWYKNNITPQQEAQNSSVNKWGWYVDLEVNSSKKGEMMIHRMTARGDSLLLTTLTPNADPCADGATYWAYGISAHTGARTKHPSFDFNRDGVHDQKDTKDGVNPSGYESGSPITLTRDGTIVDAGGTGPGQMGFMSSAVPAGRDSWQTMPLKVGEE